MPEDCGSPAVSSPSPILLLPHDALRKIFSLLPLRSAVLCRCVCRPFRDALLSPPVLPPLPLLALRHPRHCYPHPQFLHSYDPKLSLYVRFPLSFLPFPSSSPITSSGPLLYLWSESSDNLTPNPQSSQLKPPKNLVVCNPVTQSFKILPQLGSAWSRHGTVLAGPAGEVIVLAELAALYFSPDLNSWRKFSLNLPSKPRSPILIGSSIYTLCDIGSPWRSQWKLFHCDVEELGRSGRGWGPVEREGWEDVMDVLKRPRLVRGKGEGRVLMVGGLRASFAVDSPCSTVMILRLDLGRMEWEEAGRMPMEMYKCFAVGGGGGGGGNNKVKVFGGEGRVWFSGLRVRGRMAMWEEEGVVVGDGEGTVGGRWSWVEGVPGYGDGVYRGFVFNAGFTEIP